MTTGRAHTDTQGPSVTSGAGPAVTNHPSNDPSPQRSSSSLSARRRRRSASRVRTGGRLQSVSSRLTCTKPGRGPHSLRSRCPAGTNTLARADTTNKRNNKPKSEAESLIKSQSEDGGDTAADDCQTLRTRALQGDALLKLLLVNHFMQTPGSTAGNIHTKMAPFLTNKHLRDCFPAIYSDIQQRGECPPGLQPPTGYPRADGTQVEAWIHSVSVLTQGDMALVAARVLPLIGVDSVSS